jgi:hypothetical protein
VKDTGLLLVHTPLFSAMSTQRMERLSTGESVTSRTIEAQIRARLRLPRCCSLSASPLRCWLPSDRAVCAADNTESKIKLCFSGLISTAFLAFQTMAAASRDSERAGADSAARSRARRSCARACTARTPIASASPFGGVYLTSIRSRLHVFVRRERTPCLRWTRSKGLQINL